MEYVFAFAAAALLFVGFLVGTTNVPAAQFFFVLAAVMAGAGVYGEMKLKVQPVMKGRLF